MRWEERGLLIPIEIGRFRDGDVRGDSRRVVGGIVGDSCGCWAGQWFEKRGDVKPFERGREELISRDLFSRYVGRVLSTGLERVVERSVECDEPIGGYEEDDPKESRQFDEYEISWGDRVLRRRGQLYTAYRCEVFDSVEAEWKLLELLMIPFRVGICYQPLITTRGSVCMLLDNNEIRKFDVCSEQWTTFSPPIQTRNYGFYTLRNLVKYGGSWGSLVSHQMDFRSFGFLMTVNRGT
ncbi:hypothetical protein Tco_0643805 [Tanacetum coccineum]